MYLIVHHWETELDHKVTKRLIKSSILPQRGGDTYAGRGHVSLGLNVPRGTVGTGDHFSSDNVSTLKIVNFRKD